MKAYVRNPQGQEVQVIVSAYDKLTPRSAIAAADIAYGPFSHCDVVSGNKQYRVTGGAHSKRMARRIK
jgi:hypothetical protein